MISHPAQVTARRDVRLVGVGCNGPDAIRTPTAVPTVCGSPSGLAPRCSTTHRCTSIPDSTIIHRRKTLFWNVIRLLPWNPSSKHLPETKGRTMNVQRIHERQMRRLGVARRLGEFVMPEATLNCDSLARARSSP
ncbi:hypothetical protein [Nocardia cyriacigeorgica]|uniref:Uncharacterized protein n=1 Tax=Nocardia cyriacigeorgica TaxID=135487 RepID=A0A5R8NV25_9NOCA|nr:hypothetical protein [Nocardia cyriacigeorgica]TLF79399.1 hypothetical protein FEK34_08540 [Nocardia cyriacigeorgica]